MFALICVSILLIVALYINRSKRRAREKRNQEIFKTELWQQLRIKAHRLADEYDWKRLGNDFVDACYAVHKFEWGEESTWRLNFSKRIKKYWYIGAINRKPFLRGKYNKWEK